MAGCKTSAVSRQKAAWDYLKGKGLTDAQAAGVIGNLIAESGVCPESVQSGGAGRGIAQWSEGGRWQPQLMTGNEAQDLANQLDYMWTELAVNNYNGSYTALQASKTPNQAATVFGALYEQCAVCNNPGSGDVLNRITLALAVFNDGSKNLWNMDPGATDSIGLLPPLLPKGGVGSLFPGPSDAAKVITGSDLFGGLGKLLGALTSAAFWKRVGQGAAGFLLIALGAIFILSETKAGQAAEAAAVKGAIAA